MATNPNLLPFETDPSGITYKLREVGKHACQNIRSESQLRAVKQTMKVLFGYADECYEDRKLELEARLKRDAERSAKSAEFQHELGKAPAQDVSSE